MIAVLLGGLHEDVADWCHWYAECVASKYPGLKLMVLWSNSIGAPFERIVIDTAKTVSWEEESWVHLLENVSVLLVMDLENKNTTTTSSGCQHDE